MRALLGDKVISLQDEVLRTQSWVFFRSYRLLFERLQIIVARAFYLG